MNTTTKRNFKSKSKTTSKTVTLKDMILKKDQKDKTSASTSKANDSQNESFIDVFKFNAAKKKKFQTQNSQNKENKSKSGDAFDELFSEFKSRSEASKSDSASKSDDSFDELFTDFSAKAGTSTKETKPTISIEEKDFTEILRDNLSPRCPICFRKNSYDSEAIYIGHLKKCAYNNKMTMEQLKSALELQHKQTSERVALGLPIAPKERPQKKYQNKGPIDSNLELGIALSNSLQEYDYKNIIQEKEALVEAGIEPETLSQYKNLEDFGFASNKPVENTNFRGNKRGKNPPSRNTVLFTRTRQERERIITEKVASLLIDGDTQTSVSMEFISEPFILKSKYLKKHIDSENTLWKKSSQMEDDSESSYYVTALSNFITPCTVQAGSKLRHLSQIPCRPPSPGKPTISKNITACVPPSFEKLPKIKKGPKKLPPPSTADCQLRLDWKYMLNKNILSDLTIYAKNEVSIFAHKLVFYARCRSILTETIEEVENNKRSEMLMWMEYSSEAVLALLEYIYTGSLSNLNKLGDSHKKDLRALSDRYSFKDVIDELDRSEEVQMFSNDEDDSSSKDYKIPSVEPSMLPSKSPTLVQDHLSEVEIFSDDDSPKNIAVEMTEGEKNLQMMLEAMKTQNPRSPELFEDDSDTQEATNEQIKSQNRSMIEEVLSRLCSPVRSPSPKKQEIEPDVSISSEVDLIQNFENEKKVIEKRKSFSPLEKSRLKKNKTLSEDKSNEIHHKSPLSQVISLSDTSDVVDSDESLYEIRKITSDTSKSDLNDSISIIDKVNTKDPESSNSQTTQISGIDEICPRDPEQSAADEIPYVLNEQPCQEINPIWDGFDDFNSMPCDYDYFPNSVSIPINNPLRELTPPNKPKTPSRKSATESLFGSFAVEEDILNKIEFEAVIAASSKPSSSSTPDSVRKFQRRSRSENSITPINKCVWNNVTPMADYSSMKNEDLKKELEKYGIKPGLSRNKAKMMLKYIYEELHPFEDKVYMPSKIDDPVSSKDSEKNSNPSANSCESSDTSGVSLLEETYIEDDPELCTQDSLNPKTKVDLQTGFINLLHDDKLLQRKILLYEPIWLEPLKITLKEYGVRCTSSELMNYLDEKCITFRTQQQRGRRKKKKPTEEKKTRKQKTKDTVEVDDL